MGYLCANFGLPRPLCSRLRPDLRDRQTDIRQTDRQTSDRRQTKASLNAPPIRGGGIIRRSSSQPRSDQQEHEVQPATSNTHVFVPVAIETGGTWHHQAVELAQEIGRWTANITGDARESNFLFQQLSVALQRGGYGLI